MVEFLGDEIQVQFKSPLADDIHKRFKLVNASESVFCHPGKTLLCNNSLIAGRKGNINEIK